VTDLETVSRVTNGLRLYLGVTGSPLVSLCHLNHNKNLFLERSPRMNMCHDEPSMGAD
jgi:hypothetical protein